MQEVFLGKLLSMKMYDKYQFMDLERKNYNTTLNPDIIKKLKILSAETDRRQNDLLEEAILDLLKKYEHAKETK